MECCETTLDIKTTKGYLKYYRKVLENFITPLSFLDKMSEFNKDVRHSILMEPDNRPKQLKLFLDELEESANSVTLQSFLNALNDSEDQRFLYQVLNGESSDEEFRVFFQHYEDLPSIKRVFDLILPQLHVIDAEECITTFEPFLSEYERDLLRAKCNNYGNKYTIWWIFSFITTKEPSWIKEFRDFVKDHNYISSTHGTLVNLLKEYFQFDVGQTDLSSEVQTVDDRDNLTEMTLSFSYSEKAGEADVESKNNNLQTAEQSATSSANASSADNVLASGGEAVSCSEEETMDDDANFTETTMSNSFTEKDGEADLASNNNNLQTAQQCSSPSANATSADGDATSPPKKKSDNLTLRNYQRELSKLAIEGKNVIICAPPGSGKTLVASHIIKNHLEKHGNDQKKVLFFTPGGALAQQQRTQLEKYLPKDYLVDFRCGRDEQSSLLEMENVDVIVLTAQILLNEFKSKDEFKAFKQVDEFGLLVFDECHHCNKGHPYNGVMRTYFNLKNDDNHSAKLPQVVGLTATPGVGKNPRKVLSHMRQLCANLDAVDGFVTVCDEENKKELEQYVPRPERETIPVKKRPTSAFYSKLRELFDFVKEELMDIGDFSVVSLYDEENEQRNKHFKAWCEQVKNEISENDMPQEAYTCVEYLEVCEKALDFYMKLRPINAAEYLDEFVSKQDVKKLNGKEVTIYEFACAVKDRLIEMSSNSDFENPNLNHIEDLILQRFQTEPKSKAMLMVETRDYAQKIKEWTRASETLKFLNAEVFMGVANKSGTGVSGLSAKQQVQILNKFREGECKLLINTPESAGEGMDIPDCNLVINYDYLQSEIAMIQTKGRVRDQKGEMYSFASKKTERHDNFNAIKAVLMEEAVEELQKEISNDNIAFQRKLKVIQKQLQMDHQAEVLKKLSKRARTDDEEYLIKCKKCRRDLCSSLDLRTDKEGGHYMNITKEFKDKFEKKDHARRHKGEMGKSWEKMNKMHCLGCDNDLGILASWKQHLLMPLIKASGIRIDSTTDRKVRNPTPKKWSQAPFEPVKVDLDEIEKELDHLVDDE